MASTLHKEMGMMQAHLTKFKETSCEVHSLWEEVHSLRIRKVCNCVSFYPPRKEKGLCTMCLGFIIMIVLYSNEAFTICIAVK